MMLAATALAALGLGLAVVPPAEDGTKRPQGRWQVYQERLPTEDEVRAWYANGRTGLGIVTGAVSGNLEMLEFEGRAVEGGVHEEYEALAGAAGLTDVVERVFNGYAEWTPSGGIHLLYRVEGPIAGNLKLAARPGPDGKPEVLIETRGEGGYVIVAPTNGSVHPTGKPWELLQGGFDTIATITPAERDELHRIARVLDTMPKPRSAVPVVPMPAPNGDRPGDDYNADSQAALRTLTTLERHGWSQVFHRPHDGHEDVHMRRPGKSVGTSGVLHMDAGIFVCFSTSTEFATDQGYTPFAVLALLDHAGDFGAAARAIASPRAAERPIPNEPVAASPPPDDDERGEPVDDNLPPQRRRLVDGATFLLDTHAASAALWGGGDRIGWAQGESMMLCGPTGVGKTTVAQQLVLARIGIRLGDVLGLPVVVDTRRVLYIAADRPDQARRSMARMVSEEHRLLLAERLVFWRGPPPCNILKEPESLSVFAQEVGAGTVVIDSLKDIVPDLSKDESGSRYNIARQHVLAAGIDMLELHHQRKAVSGGGKPKQLDDVYGSTWLTAGAGSVFVLWGEAGDPIVELLHLKQPMEPIGPHKVRHDHHAGTTSLERAVDLLAMLRSSTKGMSARGGAAAMYDKTDPNRNEVEKARRKLDGLVRSGVAHRTDGTKGGASGGDAALYFATTDLFEESA